MTDDRAHIGLWGEQLAWAYLSAKGYAMIDHNWRMGHYELDIVAQEDNELIFVEVKTRLSPDDDPIDAVDARKRARMIASAEVFIDTHAEKCGGGAFEYRFDIIGVTGTPDDYEIEHIPDAFLPPLSRYR